MSLESTGERVIEDLYRASRGGQAILAMHAASYKFVEDLCRGKRVLDLGCGSGYGSARIAEFAASVDALDVSPEAVKYAREMYSRKNLRFACVQPDAPVPFASGCFDVVLSFQVIEHVEDDVSYLQEARRLLADDGVLVLITPDRSCRLFPGQRPWNRWHVREYSEQQLRVLVSEEFEISRMLRMDAVSELAQLELRRYRLLKWVSLPFTWPGIPESLRQKGLALMHRLKPQRGAVNMDTADMVSKFDESSAWFAERVDNSLNLLLVASPRVPSEV